jgi:hypothetical protein
MRVGESILFGALQDELRGLFELWGRRNTMKGSQVAQILVGDGSTGLVAKSFPLLSAKKGLLSERRKSGQCDKQ